MEEREKLLALLVAVARKAARADGERSTNPQVGELVVEVSKFGPPDPDAIGFLVRHGNATYSPDNTGPFREVWDIHTLSGKGQFLGETGVQRWENAEFLVVPMRGDVLEIAKSLVSQP